MLQWPTLWLQLLQNALLCQSTMCLQPRWFLQGYCTIEWAKCNMHTLPLAPKWPKTMMPYTKPLTLPNLMCLLPCQVADPIWNHVSIMILTLLFMLTTVNAPHASAAAPLVAQIVILAVVIVMLMINPNAAPWLITTAAIMMATMIFCLLARIGSLILETVNQLVMLELPLKSCPILTGLTILPTIPTQMKILITPLILTATEISKIPRQPIIAGLMIQTMNLTKHLILMTSP